MNYCNCPNCQTWNCPALAETDEDARDAARWRWVRATCAPEQARRIFSNSNPADIDSAIDTAIGKGAAK